MCELCMLVGVKCERVKRVKRNLVLIEWRGSCRSLFTALVDNYRLVDNSW